MSSDYEDFSVQIETNGDGFRVRLLTSPRGGGIVAECELPFPVEQIAESLESLARALRHPGGNQAGRDVSQVDSLPECEDFSMIDLGNRLYDGLFRGLVRERLNVCLGRVEERPEIGLRLRLVFDPRDLTLAPWLAFPWELLCRSDKSDFFGVNIRTPVVRYLPVDRPTSALPSVEVVRILVVAPRPEGMAEILSEKEMKNISAAWGSESNIEIRHLEKATLGELRRTVVSEPIHIVHFIGHGDFDEHSGDGVLFFESGAGSRRPVSGRIFAETLKTKNRVRIAVLNACESAQFTCKEGQNPFSGVASALLLSGIPAVVAHQFRISDGAAVIFSQAFYRALASGQPVDNAITQARHALFVRESQDWEWIIPVLYLATGDGDVLSIQRQKRGLGPPSCAKPDLISAARVKIELAQHRAAITSLEQALAAGEKSACLYFYLALAQIAGRRPRTLSFHAYDRVEKDLETARNLPNMGAEVLYLLALVKEDHFVWNGRVLRLPTPEQCLAQAKLRTADPDELQLILDVIPKTPGLVRSGIEARLARQGS